MKMTAQTKISLLAAIVALGLAVPAFADEGKEKNEQDIALTDCPAAVQQTINTNAVGGKVTEVEKETKKDGSIVYEADVTKTDNSKIEVKVAADGTLIKVKADDDEKEAKEGKGEKGDKD